MKYIFSKTTICRGIAGGDHIETQIKYSCFRQRDKETDPDISLQIVELTDDDPLRLFTQIVDNYFEPGDTIGTKSSISSMEDGTSEFYQPLESAEMMLMAMHLAVRTKKDVKLKE